MTEHSTQDRADDPIHQDEMLIISRAEQTKAWNEVQARFLFRFPRAHRDLDVAMRQAAMLALRSWQRGDVEPDDA